jgi:uncharacterized protein YjcR
MSQYDKKEIAKAKFITGESIQAIADQLEVSRRSVERWAEADNWRALREANAGTTPKVVRSRISSKPKPVNNDPTPHRNPAITEGQG